MDYKIYLFFSGRLLRRGLILPIVLEDECLHFLKQAWPGDVLRRFGTCVKSVVETWKRDNHDSFSFNQEFVEWIAWFVTEAAADDLDDNLDNFPELM